VFPGALVLGEDRRVIEFGILCAAWIVLLAFVSRKGTAHLVAPHVGVTLPVAGGVLGALVEALPTTPMSPGFTSAR
jgi:hypothetical protein